MNKSELIEMVSQRAKIKRKAAEDVVELVFDSMVAALVSGDKIEIRGLGSFIVREYGSYVGRNPRTGEQVQVKPKKLPYFKAGKELKERVKNQ